MRATKAHTGLPLSPVQLSLDGVYIEGGKVSWFTTLLVPYPCLTIARKFCPRGQGSATRPFPSTGRRSDAPAGPSLAPCRPQIP